MSEKGSKSREGKTVHETPAYVGKAPAPKKTEAYLLAKEKQKEEEDSCRECGGQSAAEDTGSGAAAT